MVMRSMVASGPSAVDVPGQPTSVQEIPLMGERPMVQASTRAAWVPGATAFPGSGNPDDRPLLVTCQGLTSQSMIFALAKVTPVHLY